ncbi:aminotransferase class I/II-fold pyridoxal phosphate-dependent enzyme [Frankia sp. R82]|uniref:aminotransferase class I/II-fold pyridoxal phosphate-dependent enzyme n=1 Tax=Frankia sp. R82 TaxID=2950553 RepID=UPI0035AC1079
MTGAHPLGRTRSPREPHELRGRRTGTKEFSLAGERMGITVAHPEVIGILGRIMAPYSLSVSAIRAVTPAMSPQGVAYGRATIAQIRAERERLHRHLAASAMVTRIFPSDANFLPVQTTGAGRAAQGPPDASVSHRTGWQVGLHAAGGGCRHGRAR